MLTEAFTVQQFCEAHGFSRALFYKILKEGTGPQVAKIGKRTLITKEAAARWRAGLDQKEEE